MPPTPNGLSARSRPAGFTPASCLRYRPASSRSLAVIDRLVIAEALGLTSSRSPGFRRCPRRPVGPAVTGDAAGWPGLEIGWPFWMRMRTGPWDPVVVPLSPRGRPRRLSMISPRRFIPVARVSSRSNCRWWKMCSSVPDLMAGRVRVRPAVTDFDIRTVARTPYLRP